LLFLTQFDLNEKKTVYNSQEVVYNNYKYNVTSDNDYKVSYKYETK